MKPRQSGGATGVRVCLDTDEQDRLYLTNMVLSDLLKDNLFENDRKAF